MLQLCNYPTPTVVATLMEVVKQNNYRQSPVMAEVEAALMGLLRSGCDQARSFLQEIVQGRRWLLPRYRKEIRRALSRLEGDGRGF
jgi:hypothetical protein